MAANKRIYGQRVFATRVFATRVSIFYIIEENITLTLIFQHQTTLNLKSRKCSAFTLPISATVPSQRREESLTVFRIP